MVGRGESADLLLVDGNIWFGAEGAPRDSNTAMAVANGKVLAIGETRELRARFAEVPQFDLAGRAVIPGLIDGHMHAVRAGLTWLRDLDLSDCRSPEACASALRVAVSQLPDGAWICGLGGWHPGMLGGWEPSIALLDEIAPRNPVFLQALYEFGLLNSAARQHVEARVGSIASRMTQTSDFNRILSVIEEEQPAEERGGLLAMCEAFAQRGIVGVNDPGGFGMPQEQYDSLWELVESDELPLRMRLFYSATRPGSECADIEEILGKGFVNPGNEMCRAVGIGEVVQFQCHDFEGLESLSVDSEGAEELYEIARLVAAAGRSLQVHGVLDESVSLILDCFERVDGEFPLAPLRFGIAHCDRVSVENMVRMGRLGVGAVVDDRQAFRYRASERVWGAGSLRQSPPLSAFEDAGVVVGAGTDGTRASLWDPWRSIAWLVFGVSADGTAVRDVRSGLSLSAALRAYTHSNAWFSREEGVRGRLVPGFLADFVVLDRDIWSAGEAELKETQAELTVVGGKPVFSRGAVMERTSM